MIKCKKEKKRCHLVRYSNDDVLMPDALNIVNFSIKENAIFAIGDVK